MVKLLPGQVVKASGPVRVRCVAVQPEGRLEMAGHLLILGKPGLPVPKDTLLSQPERLLHLPVWNRPLRIIHPFQ